MNYTTKEVAEILDVADRSVRRYLKTFISFENKGIMVSPKMVEILKKEHLCGQDADNLRTGADTDEKIKNINVEFEVVEGFSKEEYAEFQKRLIEYPILKKDLEYHRESVKSHQRQMEMILKSIQERNLIEAKDKKIVN